MAGYFNFSMSNNAKNAYESGEKPFSKWTKTELFYEIKNWLKEGGELNCNLDLLKKIKLSELKSFLLKCTSWHHTSKFYNETDFYSIDFEELENLTDEELKKWQEENKKEKKTEKEKTEKIKGDIYYLTWEGTKKHPKAVEHCLKDVTIEERGSFYIVYDENGKEILRKKIFSNGTRVYYSKGE